MDYKKHNYVCHTSSAKFDAVYSGVIRFLLELNLKLQKTLLKSYLMVAQHFHLQHLMLFTMV